MTNGERYTSGDTYYLLDVLSYLPCSLRDMLQRYAVKNY